METNSSGEELVVKQARKPYTITKQREKWTEEEHNKFIEALKLYGRAWQRIEEYIGTKTAVQIRSHAQKFFTKDAVLMLPSDSMENVMINAVEFLMLCPHAPNLVATEEDRAHRFSQDLNEHLQELLSIVELKTYEEVLSAAQKLEKEAVVKGVPFGQAPDIEIPPPRPKRKPSSPYPRKTGAGSLSPSSETTDEKTSKSQSLLTTCKQSICSDNHAAWKIRGAKENSEEGSCSEVINLFQDVRAASNSSVSKDFSGFMALEKEMRDKASLKDNKDTKENGMVNTNLGSEEFKGAAILEPTDKIGQTDQSYANNAPVDFKKRNGDENVNVKPSLNPTIPSTSEMNVSSGTSSIHQSFQTFPPFGQLPTNQDAHKSFLNVSSTFWNAIMFPLLQNPAVHAAASVAASFWPSTGLDVLTASSSESIHGGLPTRHTNPNPSMAAIAAATVAAAAAWWATQGLLPVYHPPLHTGFAFSPAPITTIPIVDTAVAPNNKKEDRGDDLLENSVAADEQVVDPEQSGAVRASSSSDSGEGGRVELTGGKTNIFSMDTGKARNTKNLDRSSCGSNTPSSSEVETDAVLKMQDGDKEVEPKQVQLNTNPPSVETSTRRNRSSTGIMYESWKEVSEEGRIAFQALFNREVLPQSFLPPDATEPMLMAAKNKGGTGELHANLNGKASNEPPNVYHIHGLGGTTRKNAFPSETGHGKQKVRRTGFKPYKRCSMEATEGRATAGDETGNKRIRLEGETPI